MLRNLIIIGSLTLLASCSSDATAVQPGLQAACSDAMALAPIAGPIAPYIIAGCGTAEAIDDLAADPTSTEWVGKLIGQIIPASSAPPKSGSRFE